MKYLKSFKESSTNSSYREITKDEYIDLEMKYENGDYFAPQEYTLFINKVKEVLGDYEYNITEYGKKNGFRYETIRVEFKIEGVEVSFNLTKFEDEWFTVCFNKALYNQGRYLCDGIFEVLKLVDNVKEISSTLLSNYMNSFYKVYENKEHFPNGKETYKEVGEAIVDEILEDRTEYFSERILKMIFKLLDDTNYFTINNHKTTDRNIFFNSNSDIDKLYDFYINVLNDEYYLVSIIKGVDVYKEYICDQIMGIEDCLRNEIVGKY